METYFQFAMALMQGKDPAEELEAIRRLPIEKRYIWRVASALKWGFADFDDLGVDADRQTLSSEDLAKVMDLLKLAVLHSPQDAGGRSRDAEMMVQAIGVAKQQG